MADGLQRDVTTDISIQQPIAPAQVNTGSIVGDAINAISFGVQLFERQERKEADNLIASEADRVTQLYMDTLEQTGDANKAGFVANRAISSSGLPPSSLNSVNSMVIERLKLNTMSKQLQGRPVKPPKNTFQQVFESFTG